MSTAVGSGDRSRLALVWTLRALVLLTFLAAWQFLPRIGWLQDNVRFMNPFYISSPVDVAKKMWDICFSTQGSDGSIAIWSYLANTLKATFVGFAIGAAAGLVAGAVLSGTRIAADVIRPFIVAFNTMPRIALIPIIVVIAGIGFTANVINCVLIVFFLVFFAAFDGGRSVPASQLSNVEIIGASRAKVMMRVRLPYSVLWVFGALPNAISFGLLVVVTTELLTGTKGVGSLLLLSTTNLDATLTLALAFLLSIVGLAMVGLAELIRSRAVGWAVD